MIYCILGQTASGKTSLAIQLAKEFYVPIISADAYQCYKMMQVGTDKPTKEEIEGIDYYFYDEYEVDQEISVFDFQKECRPILERYLKEGKDVLVVGGNFLYVKALLFNYVFQNEENNTNPYENMSLSEMQTLLKERDIKTYQSIDYNNPRRVLRALVQLDQGRNHTSIKEMNDGKPIYPVEFYRLDIDKEEGNRKIDLRIDKMVEEGLIKEVTSLYQKYPTKSRLFTTIGYQEIVQALKEKKPIDQSVIDLIKIHTHQYAKKQRTFLRHQFPLLHSGSKEEIAQVLKNKLQKG